MYDHVNAKSRFQWPMFTWEPREGLLRSASRCVYSRRSVFMPSSSGRLSSPLPSPAFQTPREGIVQPTIVASSARIAPTRKASRGPTCQGRCLTKPLGCSACSVSQSSAQQQHKGREGRARGRRRQATPVSGGQVHGQACCANATHRKRPRRRDRSRRPASTSRRTLPVLAPAPTPRRAWRAAPAAST